MIRLTKTSCSSRIHLAFETGSTTQDVQISGDETGDGVWEPVITGGGAGGGGDCLCFDEGGGGETYDVTGQSIESSQGEPAILWMIIPGQAEWLKEFFDVQMIVSNLAPSPFSFDNGSVTIGPLPNGLSIAPTDPPQTSTQSIADIPSDSSGTAKLDPSRR